MLKKNKMISVYAISTIAVVATIGIISMLNVPTDDVTKAQLESRPPSIVIGNYGQTVSSDIVKEKVSFRISTVKSGQFSSPTMVKTISAENIFQIYSPGNKIIDDNTPLPELMANGGLVIWQEKLGDNVNVSNIINEYEQNVNAQILNVQGFPAIATQKQPENDIPTLLHVFRDDKVRVTLMSSLPIEELVKIAENMDLSVP